jgi:hypothetical protein
MKRRVALKNLGVMVASVSLPLGMPATPAGGEHFARQMASAMLKQQPDAVLVFSAGLAQALRVDRVIE